MEYCINTRVLFASISDILRGIAQNQAKCLKVKILVILITFSLKHKGSEVYPGQVM